MDKSLVAELADALSRARRDRTLVAAADLPTPPDIASAAVAQAKFHQAFDQRVSGWKVALGPGETPIAAPLWPLAESPSTIDWRVDQAVEIEICVRLKRDLPCRPGQPYSREEIDAAIGSVHLGVEIIASRLREAGNAPFHLFLGDALGNGGYVLGPELPERYSRALAGASLVVRRGDIVAFDGTAAHPADDPLRPLVAYCNRPMDALGGLRKGQIVTTGSICGVIGVARPARVEAIFADEWRVQVTFVPDQALGPKIK